MIKNLGLVLECGRDGPDELVFRCLTRRLSPDTVVHPICTGNKKTLFENGVQLAQTLTKLCDLVLVVWDLQPPWEKEKGKRNCKEDAEKFRKQLEKIDNQVIRKKIKLLCITHELETWLCMDKRAVQHRLGERCKYAAPSDWQAQQNPKRLLEKTFAQHGKIYTDVTEAIKICKRIQDSNRLRKVQSFKRYAKLLTGDEQSNFVQPLSNCDDLVHESHELGRPR